MRVCVCVEGGDAYAFGYFLYSCVHVRVWVCAAAAVTACLLFLGPQWPIAQPPFPVQTKDAEPRSWSMTGIEALAHTRARGHGSVPLQDRVPDPAHPHHVSDPLPRSFVGPVVELDSLDPENH